MAAIAQRISQPIGQTRLAIFGTLGFQFFNCPITDFQVLKRKRDLVDKKVLLAWFSIFYQPMAK
jgi:hypothetical protein